MDSTGSVTQSIGKIPYPTHPIAKRTATKPIPGPLPQERTSDTVPCQTKMFKQIKNPSFARVIYKTVFVVGLIFTGLLMPGLPLAEAAPSPRLEPKAEIAEIEDIISGEPGILRTKSLETQEHQVLLVGVSHGDDPLKKQIRQRCAEKRTCTFIQEGLLRLDSAEQRFRKTFNFKPDSPVFGLDNAFQTSIMLAHSSIILRTMPSIPGSPTQDHVLAVTSFARHTQNTPGIEDVWKDFVIGADPEYATQIQQTNQIASALAKQSLVDVYSDVTPRFLNQENSGEWADLIAAVARRAAQKSDMPEDQFKALLDAVNRPYNVKAQEVFASKCLAKARENQFTKSVQQVLTQQPSDRAAVVWLGAAHVDNVAQGLKKGADKPKRLKNEL